jgi:hypothetical protein
MQRRAPKIAPAFSACPSSMALAEKCSCIFGIPAIHGGKNKARGAGFVLKRCLAHYSERLDRQNRKPAVNLNVRGTPVMLPMLL